MEKSEPIDGFVTSISVLSFLLFNWQHIFSKLYVWKIYGQSKKTPGIYVPDLSCRSRISTTWEWSTTSLRLGWRSSALIGGPHGRWKRLNWRSLEPTFNDGRRHSITQLHHMLPLHNYKIVVTSPSNGCYEDAPIFQI